MIDGPGTETLCSLCHRYIISIYRFCICYIVCYFNYNIFDERIDRTNNHNSFRSSVSFSDSIDR